jgi:hypothetical protein
LTKNAFRFVKVRLGLAHKKASCQGRDPTFSRWTKSDERVEAKKKLDCGVVRFTLDKMAVLFLWDNAAVLLTKRAFDGSTGGGINRRAQPCAKLAGCCSPETWTRARGDTSCGFSCLGFFKEARDYLS